MQSSSIGGKPSSQSDFEGQWIRATGLFFTDFGTPIQDFPEYVSSGSEYTFRFIAFSSLLWNAPRRLVLRPHDDRGRCAPLPGYDAMDRACSIRSRCGSQTLAETLRLGIGSGGLAGGAPESGVTSMAGFAAASESEATSMAGFADCGPQRPG